MYIQMYIFFNLAFHILYMYVVKAINKSCEAEEGKLGASVWMKEINLCNLLFIDLRVYLGQMPRFQKPTWKQDTTSATPCTQKNCLFLHLQRRIGALHTLQVLFHLALRMVLNESKASKKIRMFQKHRMNKTLNDRRNVVRKAVGSAWTASDELAYMTKRLLILYFVKTRNIQYNMYNRQTSRHFQFSWETSSISKTSSAYNGDSKKSHGGL